MNARTEFILDTLKDILVIILVLAIAATILAGWYSLSLGLFYPLPVSDVVRVVLMGIGSLSLIVFGMIVGGS